MDAVSKPRTAIIERLRPELEKAFRDVPAFGEIGFRVFFADSEPVRVEYSAALSRKLIGRGAR